MAKNPPRKLSAPALLGKLVGATVALPTAGLAYAAALWQGVALSTAMGRAVVVGVIMFVGLSLLTRVLMHTLGRELGRSPSSGLKVSRNSELPAATGSEAA
ncbi:MAG: hypothetical protein V3W41_17220 [Planctomycetota bacterium]